MAIFNQIFNSGGSCMNPPSLIWAKFGKQVWAYGEYFSMPNFIVIALEKYYM